MDLGGLEGGKGYSGGFGLGTLFFLDTWHFRVPYFQTKRLRQEVLMATIGLET